MKIFNIDNDWTIKLPKNWKEERDDADGYGYHLYYPPDSDLTIIITTFHFFKNIENGWKVFSPVDDLSQIFNESIKKIELRNNIKVEEKKLNLNEFKIEDLKVECFKYKYYENNEKVYSISCGIMITGYLLVINLYSASKDEVENAIKYIYSIEKIK